MSEVIEKAKELAIDGLLTDGEYHKQWYLEQILIALGYDLKEISQEIVKQDFQWEVGIAP